MTRQCFVNVTIVLMVGAFILFGAAWASAGEKSMLEKAGISVGGFVDTSYSTNLNEPADRQSNGRVYDTEADSFRMNTAHLFMGKEATAESRAGFFVALDFGKNADVSAQDGTNATDQVDFQEAYVNYLLPVGKGLTVTAGIFRTLGGAENINSNENMNFSNSYAFGFGPKTHTGLRLSYDVSSKVGLTLGALNGWDNLDDNNDAKTLEAGVSLDLTDKVSWNHAIYYGSEQDERTSSQRFFYDTVMTYTPSSRFKFVTQVNYGKEQQDGARSSALFDRSEGIFDPDFSDSAFGQNSRALLGHGGEWNALVGYANYTPTEKLGFTLRGERFDDYEGARTGIDQVLYGLTLTSSYQLTPDLMTRLEYRYDISNQNVFGTDAADELSNNQTTIGAQLIYSF